MPSETERRIQQELARVSATLEPAPVPEARRFTRTSTSRRLSVLAVAAAVAVIVVGASVLGGLARQAETAPEPAPPVSSPTRQVDSIPSPMPSETPRRKRFGVVVADGEVLPNDLEVLARRFVEYAVGERDRFPMSPSIYISLGGRTVESIDDNFGAPARTMWQGCPADVTVYGASSCPVDLLSPLLNAQVNRHLVEISAQGRGVVACEPTGSQPPEGAGRIVVLRPTSDRRSCASDYAITIFADGQGDLIGIDLALSEP